MEYGFIYIWYDRKRKMFYLGSHWGTETDGYICSSNRMRDAYRRRPQDFKRRIVKSNVRRDDLLNEEHRWLSFIADDELGKRYYNLRKHKWGHWSTDIDDRRKVSEKISQSKAGRPGHPHSEETKQKIREARKKQGAPSVGHKLSEETKQKMRKPKPPRSEEHSRKLSESLKGKPSPLKGKILKPESTSYSTIYMRTYNK
jgi:hypothetical protein